MTHAFPGLAAVLGWLTTGKVVAIALTLLGAAWLSNLRDHVRGRRHRAPVRWDMAHDPTESKYDLQRLNEEYSPKTGRPRTLV